MNAKISIFKNIFNLNYKDDCIQEEFNKMRRNKLSKNNLWFFLLTLLVSIINVIIHLAYNNVFLINNTGVYYCTFYTSISINAITFVNLILVFFVENFKFRKYSTLLSYNLLTISFLICRDSLLVLQIDQNKITVTVIILFLVELTARFLLYYSNMIAFLQGFLTNSLCIFTLVLYSVIVYGRSINYVFICGYIIVILFLIVLTYFYNSEMKKTFYVNYQLEKKNKWHSSIMNNMNSGFICIKDRKIDFVNFPMLLKMKGNKEISKILGKCEILNEIPKDHIDDNILLRIPGHKIEKTNEEVLSIIKENEQVSTKILDVILFEFNCDMAEEKILNSDLMGSNNNNNLQAIPRQRANSDLHNSNSNLMGQFSSFEFLQKFKSNYLNKNLDEHFTFVGYKDLEVQTQCNGVTTTELINMEITGRFYKSSECNQSETFEFIFKDMTRTKLIEEKNAEIKYKTLFLSKVAHEFKNPIICIIELVNQINDVVQQNKEENIKNDILPGKELSRKNSINNTLKKSLPIIKALSNYLLILVKDLDYFSQNQIGQASHKVDLHEADLQEILEFCAEISDGLLKKNNKHSQVSFVLKKEKNLPEKIFTDDTKLKQILINLISNAVKFTDHGSVTLGVDIQREDVMRFQIQDTGPGITDEQKSNLFRPYIKSSSKNNKIGAGLGLIIVSDLINHLGSKINYDSKVGEGTKFWFDMKYTKSNNSSQIDNMHPISHRSEKKKSLFHNIKTTEIEVNEINLNVINNSITSKVHSLESDTSQITIKQDLNSYNQIISNQAQIAFGNNNYYLASNIVHPIETILSQSFVSESNSDKDYFFDSHPNVFNYIVADDEEFTRKAVIRVLTNAAKKLKKKVNLIESEDGIETLFIIYQSVIKGAKITGIISDETMKLMSGSKSAQLLKSIDRHSLNRISFIITTAYENHSAIEKLNFVDAIYNKPINIHIAEKCLSINIV